MIAESFTASQKRCIQGYTQLNRNSHTVTKETEDVAKELREYSRGQIKTGVYHAEVPDSLKESLHVKWREGEIKVVCATIGMYSMLIPPPNMHVDSFVAFGLGIDKGNVRFVIHHSVSDMPAPAQLSFILTATFIDIG